ncbi:MAG: right-handed parallel beta-helix repeat-containing protein [Candidatus Kariarchaeaceae archaeon]|jgi:parallel beta-helix repeat protein
MKTKTKSTLNIFLVLILLSTFGSVSNATTKDPQLSQITSTISITSDADFLSLKNDGDINGSGTEGDPYLIVADIDGGGSGDLISISNTNAHYRIADSDLRNGDNGIVLNNAHNGTVDTSVIRNNGENGIKLINTFNTTFNNNNVYENGIDICPHTLNLNQIRLKGHAGSGWHFDPSGYSQISNNYIHDNYIAGIIIEDATNINITSNIIENNGKNCATSLNLELSLAGENDGQGIDVYDGTNINITGNDIKSNLAYGVYLSSISDTNHVKANNIMNNNENAQAFDEGTANIFECNYWGTTISTHNIDPSGNKKDTCGRESVYNFDIFDYPVVETTEDTNDDESDDGFLFYPFEILSLLIVALTYKRNNRR